MVDVVGLNACLHWSAWCGRSQSFRCMFCYRDAVMCAMWMMSIVPMHVHVWLPRCTNLCGAWFERMFHYRDAWCAMFIIAMHVLPQRQTENVVPQCMFCHRDKQKTCRRSQAETNKEFLTCNSTWTNPYHEIQYDRIPKMKFNMIIFLASILYSYRTDSSFQCEYLIVQTPDR